MPYSALPAARRIHYEIDGSVLGFNSSGSLGAGMTTVLTSANMLALNEETPTVDTTVFTVDTTTIVYALFPESVDLSFFMFRMLGAGGLYSIALQGSPDTTTGADGTWTTVGTGSGTSFSQGTGDWWRSVTPQALTSNNTNLRGVRFGVGQNVNTQNFRNLYLWGHKHSGQTPDDLIILESDNTTEWPNDDDWGDLNAGGSAVTHQYYVKNSSATKQANSVVVKMSGSDASRWSVSLDNVSFGSSQSVGTITAGSSQVVYVKFTPPSPAGGVYRPWAAYLEADAASWT